MAAKHGTHSRYSQGCRCDACTEGHRLTAREYAQRKAAGQVRPRVHVVEIPPPSPDGSPEPGPVEAAVQEEISALAQAQSRPALVAIAAAMAHVLDSTPPTPKPAAAKVLVTVLDTLRKSAPGRRGNLALVRTMTEKGNESG